MVAFTGGAGPRDGRYYWEDTQVISRDQNDNPISWSTQFGTNVFPGIGTDVTISGFSVVASGSAYANGAPGSSGAHMLTLESGTTLTTRGLPVTDKLINRGALVNEGGVRITGSIENEGSIRNGSNMLLSGVADLFTLKGTGTLEMQSGLLTGYTAGGNGNADAATRPTFSIESRIDGFGQIGTYFGLASYPGDGGYLKLHNTQSGTVDADVDGKELVLHTGLDAASPIRNDGVLSASNGGRLMVADSVAVNGLGKSYLQQGASGVVRANDGSTVELEGTQVTGGTLDSVGSGIVRLTGFTPTLTDVTITARATVDIGRGTDLNGSIVNHGLLTNSDGNAKTYGIAAAGVTLTGGGRILMADEYYEANIAGAGAGAVLTNVDNTIIGVGAINGGNLTVVNRSLIAADRDTIRTNDEDVLAIDALAGLVNTGTLEARNGARLEVKGFTTALENKGGLIQAVGVGSKVAFSSTVDGGTFNGVSGGVVDFGSATLDGRVNAVTVQGQSYTGDTKLMGTIVNQGTMTSGGSNSQLKIKAEDAVLTGGGTVRLAGAYDNPAIVAAADGAKLTNVDNTIIGVGAISGDALSIVNQGRIVANMDSYRDGDVFSIDPVASLDNRSGELAAQNGATLRVVRINDGVLKNAGGVIQAVGKGSVVEVNVNVAGGTLKTSGGGLLKVFNSTTLDGNANQVTIAGDVSAVDRQNVKLKGAIANKGDIELFDSGFTIAADTFLSGGGSVHFAQSDFWRAAGLAAGAAGNKLVNLDNTISGVGTFGQNSGLVFSNGTKGTLLADTKNDTLTLQTGRTVTNAGELAAANGGTLDIRDKVAGTGHIEVRSGGTVIVDQGVDHDVMFSGAGAGTLFLSSRSPANSAKGFDFTIGGIGVGDRIKLEAGAAAGKEASFTFTDTTTKFGESGTLTTDVFKSSDGKALKVKLEGAYSEGQFTLVGGKDGSFGYVRVETRDGTAKADILKAAGGGERVIGLGGDDVLIGGKGNDLLDGSRGSDTASYAAAKSGVTVNLGTKAYQTIGGGMGKDSLIAVENLVGSAFGDKLKGSAEANVLIGGKGADDLFGGADKVTDTFVFLKGDSGLKAPATDQIFDFHADTIAAKGKRSAGADLIDLSLINGVKKLAFVDDLAKTGKGQVTVDVIGAGAAKHAMVLIDTDGNGKADMGIEVMNVVKLSADDFLL